MARTKKKNPSSGDDARGAENVLLLLLEPGGKDHVALVSRNRLGLSDAMLLKLTGADIHTATTTVAEAIAHLWHRLGLEGNLPISADLKDCLDPEPPFTVHQVVTMAWGL